jgi:CRP-like cAMP-binding protein
MTTPANLAQRLSRLGSVPLLSSLLPEQIERIARAGNERTFPAGTTIVRQEEKGPGLYLLLEGRAEVLRSGRKVVTLAAGEFFGEAALLVEQPRTADVRAATDVRCFVLNRWEFWGAMGIDPERNQALFEATVQRLRSFGAELVE